MTARSTTLIGNMIDLLEAQGAKKFKLGKPTKGTSFETEKSITIPAGTYTTIEPDDRDDSRLIISNDKTDELYAISKKLAK